MKFGSREIVDVVFKATRNGQKLGTKVFQKYQPVFKIDTARTSSLEQSATTVYAQGGKGFSRLIAWEGEKTMTFTVEDALLSPMGLAVLTGAGISNPGQDGSQQAHVHATIDAYVDENGIAEVTFSDLCEETKFTSATKFTVCNTIDMFATELDGSGAGIDWISGVKLMKTDGTTQETEEYINVYSDSILKFYIPGKIKTTVQLDFYLIMNSEVTEIDIKPEDFGGYFYVEAQTLYRREDTGEDMAAELIFPKVKIQSNFTLTMAANGDPSTFNFVMDAFPGYSRFDSRNKRLVIIQILGTDNLDNEADVAHTHKDEFEDKTPELASYNDVPDELDNDPTTVPIKLTGTKKVAMVAADANQAVSQANQDMTRVEVKNNGRTINIKTDVAKLNKYASTDPNQGEGKWVGLDINTNTDDITKLTYNGSPLTQADVDEAASVGLGAGHLVLWLKAESTFPKKITLAGDGYETTEITITLNK